MLWDAAFLDRDTGAKHEYAALTKDENYMDVVSAISAYKGVSFSVTVVSVGSSSAQCEGISEELGIGSAKKVFGDAAPSA